MEKIFSEVLRLSALAGAMVPVILVIRFFLEKVFRGKVPKSLCCFLWMLVGIRLTVPFSVESVFGLFPEEGIFSQQRMLTESAFNREAGTDGKGAALGQSEPANAAPGKSLAFSGQGEYQPELLRRERAQTLMLAGSGIWYAGMLMMLGYFVHSWLKLKRCVRASVQIEYSLGNGTVTILQCGGIETPFLFGFLHPEIYVPFHMNEEDLPYIVRHELAHRRRRDHLVKPFSFLLLSVHWFNPFIWIAFRMLCRDMELACDEMVIRDMEVKDRKAYSRALLNCSIWKEKAAACPVAFGELSVKERVRNILNYKKPGILAIGLGVVICAGLLCGFMTRRKEGDMHRILLTNEAGSGLVEREADAEQTTAQMDDVQTIPENQGAAASDEEERARQTAFVEEWAQTVCDRDGEVLVALCSEKLLETFREGETVITLEGDDPGFGWSSPWPWDSGADWRVVSQSENAARILYYAWTSDPHVTVWEEDVTWHRENGRYVMDTSDMNFLDAVCTGEEFYGAYPEGIISGTRMDYLGNGAGEALNNNAKTDREFYEPLFEPDTAARFLLNLLNNEDKVEITAKTSQEDEGGEKAQVSIRFILDHTQVSVTMIRPYGEDGIWIPQTWEE